MAVDLARVAKQKGIKYFLINFVDMFGVLRAKLVPARAIGAMQKEGAGFAGFAAWLDMTPAHPDMFAIPDAESLIQLPWKPEVGWLAADLWMDGVEVEASPRIVLKRQIARAAKKGWRMKTGVECEFFLIAPDGEAISDPLDIQPKPCYDQSALMRRYDVISAICDSMIELGWEPYQNDHEDANGQFEMNWEYDDCLRTADKHAFFKYMVKSIAEEHGFRATFMPKPFDRLTGNGCHAHVSIWDKAGRRNLFHDRKDDVGISKMGYHFLGGIMHSADALCAIFNPTVNSYKRINAPVTASGATWSPNAVTYGGNNRTHMVRIPDAGRFELRLMDGSTNPYLMQAGVLAAGLDGVAEKRDPGERLDINMYEEGGRLRRVKRLPLNLLDALRLMEKNKILRDAFGKEVVQSYLKLRMQDWNDFMSHPSAWERKNTLDC
ncbi:MAG: type III glutamate--ammonia ligase [Rhodospirillales bacterium]|mgnify:CR=1 FL=1|jgi:glutamine synthetase|nr:type III glutamate--ammonia ligase [Rhodospirillales bacterium]MDP6772953.1 type III glutamate--ammonia ligase [Rhodospirillales bacterium]